VYRKLRVGVVIPAFNESRAIAETVATIPDFVDEVIVVDDCSIDDTSERARVNPDVNIIRHAHNRGVGGAIATGYRHALAAGVDVAVVMGGDGQMDPRDLPALLDPIADGAADYVKGNRFLHPDVWTEMPPVRIAGNVLLSTATRVTSGYGHVFDSQCGYTAIHRDALAKLDLDVLWTRYGYPNDLLARLHAAGVRVVDVRVRPIYGEHWKSGIHLGTVLHPLPWVLLRSWAMRLAAERRAPGPMRIGVVTTSYPRFPGDHAGGFVAAHVRAMRALGHDVEVIAAGEVMDARGERVGATRGSPFERDIGDAARGSRFERDVTSSRFYRGGAPDLLERDVTPDLLERDVTRIPSSLFYRGGAPDLLERGGAGPAAVAFTARLAAEVARRARHWDLAVAHWLAPSALAALPSRVPLLAIAHGGDVHTLARLGLLRPTLAALRVRGAKLAFVSAALRDLAARHGDVRDAIVQPMGVDVAHFAALGRAPTTPPTLLVLARLVPIKGVDVAIAAMKHVATPARLVVAGDGPERAALPQRDNVELIGTVDHAHRDRLLRAASLVVVPSRVLANGRTEGMPTVALEALAAGVPVVASAVGGLRELAAATHVPPDDPATLAASIDRVLAAPPPGEHLRASVADFAWPDVAARLLAHADLRARA
jgi:glycosyltransferase involved in cell wall biosynthesis